MVPAGKKWFFFKEQHTGTNYSSNKPSCMGWGWNPLPLEVLPLHQLSAFKSLCDRKVGQNWTLTVLQKQKNDVITGDYWWCWWFYYAFGDNLAHSCTLPNFVLIALQAKEIRRGGGNAPLPMPDRFSKPHTMPVYKVKQISSVSLFKTKFKPALSSQLPKMKDAFPWHQFTEHNPLGKNATIQCKNKLQTLMNNRKIIPSKTVSLYCRF